MIYESQELYIVKNGSLASDFDSFAQDIRGFQTGSMQIAWTGATSTDAQLIPQASNDGLNWCNLVTGTSIKKIDDVAGCQMYTFTVAGYKWLRLHFLAKTNAGGTADVLTLMKRSYQNA